MHRTSAARSRRPPARRYRPSASGGGERIIGGEQRAPRFLVDLFFEGVAAPYDPRLGDCRAFVDRVEPAPDVRVGCEWIIASRKHKAGTVDPAPGRDVGYGVAGADDEAATFKMLVEHGVVAFRLAPITIDGVGQLLRGRTLEVHGLAGKRAEPGADVEQPREQLAAIGRR